MKQDNPFAKLGALDQKLYQDTMPKSQAHLAENASKPSTRHTQGRKPPLPVISSTKQLQKKETKTSDDTMTPRNHATTQPRYHDTKL